MDKIAALNNVFQGMKIKATAVRADINPPYSKFWVELGPSETLKKLENKAVEIGLAMKASAPICTPDYANGAVMMEFMEGKHPLVKFEDSVDQFGFSAPENVLSAHVLKQAGKTKAAGTPEYELPCFLGVTDVVNPLVVDLVDFPHLLIAGSTGSGKSVCMHSIYQSLQMHAQVNRVKFVLIDPKVLEFSRYAKDKNLRYEVATTPKHADAVLLDLTEEMEKRLRLLKDAGCRDLREYRARTGNGSYIVVFIDELSDLMQASGKRFEESLCRLAQKARAAGIHIVQATQYPKADIVTSKIKANFDGRICFKVVDAPQSRVMLGDKNNAAAYLEGKGDAYISGSRFQMQRFRGALVKEADRPKPGLFSAVTSMFAATIS